MDRYAAPRRSAGWSDELELLAACCRWPPSVQRDAAVRRACEVAIHWDAFERIVAHHRVAGLVDDGLRCAGIAIPAGIAEQARRAARQELAMARESLRLQRLFDEAGVRAILLKGSALAMQAYGRLGIKQSWDIDLLTEAESAVQARDLLTRHGYELVDPKMTDARFRRFVTLGKECVFTNPSLRINLELHWRLMDNPELLAGVDAGSPVQDVALGKGRLRTLADAPLFAYLAAHGTAHGWTRLKWLADFAAFLSRRSEIDVVELYREAGGLGAGRTPAVGLLLCNRLLGLAIEPNLLRQLREDRVVDALCATSLRCLSHGGGYSEFGFFSRTGLRFSASHFALSTGGRYVRRQLGLLWNSDADRARIPLPRGLRFLYHLLRLPLMLERRGDRLLARLRG